METLEGDEQEHNVATSVPLEALMYVILHLMAVVPVRPHRQAACLGLPSQERSDEHRMKVRGGDIMRREGRYFSPERSISVPLRWRAALNTDT